MERTISPTVENRDPADRLNWELLLSVFFCLAFWGAVGFGLVQVLPSI